MGAKKEYDTCNTVNLQRTGLWVGAIASLASWYISLVLTFITAVVPGYLPAAFDIHPTLAQGFGGVILVMVLSMIVIYEYMIRKSEVSECHGKEDGRWGNVA